ncbi:MAG TPA: alpha-2-macroglobulin family protein [Verrucomicrobiae bacterium]
MNLSTRIFAVVAVFLVQVLSPAASLNPRFAEAERLYREGSYKQAHNEYQKLAGDLGNSEDRRWVDFRLVETAARAEAASQNADDSAFRAAEQNLRKFVDDNARIDRVRAEALEALGDIHWFGRNNQYNWHPAWQHYQQALDFWAGSTNLTYAAERYWSIIQKASQPPRVQPYYYYGHFGNYIPLPVLENALKIARNEDERARAHFMIAMTLRSGGSWEQRFRIPHHFEESLRLKKDTNWYDDALYHYGEWMASQGTGVQDENGNWTFHPNYTKALEVFRRLTNEFRQGETQWHDDAQRRINEIIQPSLQLSVSHVFLPESEVEFYINWRNIDSVEFTLYKTDLTAALGFGGKDVHSHGWIQTFNPANGEKVKTWKWEPNIARPHAPGNDRVRLEEKLPIGAYILVGRADKVESRELILVSDVSVVTQATGSQLLVYVCDAGNGAPVKNASVRVWERRMSQNSRQWRSQDKNTDEKGTILFELNGDRDSRELFVIAKSGDKQAFSIGHSGYAAQPDGEWRIYAHTDRPAYRPGEKVQWKITARTLRGNSYAIPSGQTITMRIADPRGAEIRKEKLKLNEFGSAWGEVDLSAEMPLGQYNVTFQNERESTHIGSATLFRLEEYKLPEFKVAVQTPEENGRRKTFLLGEKVEVEIRADYYFGGPVANATVEAVVYQNPYYQYWVEPREFEWLYQEDGSHSRYRGGNGQVVQRETLKTDAEGKATLVIQSPLNQGNDLEYRIEARVTDASRREIVGSDRVRVTRQRFFVHAKPLHRIHKPQDKVEVEFRAQDANEQPVVAEGKVQVTRSYWYEVWIAPDGREVQGEELKRLQSAAIFPPRPEPGNPGWRLKFRGYQHDEILTRTLKTGTNGIAMIDFVAPREGYYRISWRSDEEITPGQDKIPGRPVRAETVAWVATGRSADLGYRSGGLEILVDKQSFRSGEKTPVMLTVPGNDRYVLFTVAGADLIDYQLVHLDGSVKLLELPIDEKHVPNAFLHASMVADQQLHSDVEEIVVPPVKHFLNLSVTPDREQYRPGEKGTWKIKTLDLEGKPVSAEVALSVADESVYYISEDLSGDPRQFFFGQKRHAILQTVSSFNYKTYTKLLPRAEEELARDELSDTRAGRLNYFYDATGASKRRDLSRYSDAPARNVRSGLADTASLAAAPAMAEMDVFAGAKLSLAKEAKSERQEGVSDFETLAAQAPGGGEESAVQVRSDFRSTIAWEPGIKTDRNGEARVEVTYPDSLTTWRATARAVTTATQFGIEQESVRTKMPLIVRLQAPRFFLAGDTVTVSAIINNNTDSEITVTPALEAAGIDLPKIERAALKIAANSEGRADWTIHPRKAGQVKLKVTARGGGHADSMERGYTVYEHGIDKFIATSGKTRGSELLAMLRIPAERKPGTTVFNVSVTPSMAVTMLDALPYLVNYPYGCVEQTMSRFLPATITAKTLSDLGLKPEEVLNRAFGGIEANAPVRKGDRNNLKQLSDVTQKGLQRLYDFQHGDGGWGWWKEGDSDAFMTAYVLWGLVLAREANVEIKADVIDRAAAWLDTQLVEAENQPDLQAWILHALAVKAASDKTRSATEFQAKAFENLWASRDRLNAYTRALFALGAHHLGKAEEARTLIRNLENGVQIDNAPASSQLNPGRSAGSSNAAQSTAHWGNDGIHYRWSEGGVEATAFALRALLAIDPQNKLVEPVANWLIKNRRGAQWSNTRDTAIVLLALNDYLRVTKEVQADLDYEVFVNGTPLGRKKLADADVFNAPSRFNVPQNLIRDGENQIRILKHSGTSPIYFAAEATYFSLEEPITAAGNEIFVKRQYYRLRAVPTLLKGYAYEKVELRAGDEVPSGERLETVLTIEAKNNYEYLVFEDLKPAGIEAVEIRSGENVYARRVRAAGLMAANASGDIHTEQLESERYSGDTRWVYQELRDRKVALFVDKLPQGFWEIRYETRAEVPGEFHALPVVAHAMYVPEIRANSAEQIVTVVDK